MDRGLAIWEILAAESELNKNRSFLRTHVALCEQLLKLSFGD